MAIVFDWYENPNASSEEEAALHPRIFMNGKVDTDTLCYKIHDYSSLTVGDVKNVLDNLSKILGESLREGKEVHIEEIGNVSEFCEKLTGRMHFGGYGESDSQHSA